MKYQIERMLKNYNVIKAEIATFEARIKMLQDLIALEDLSDFYEKNQTNFKTPLIRRPTESAAISEMSAEKFKLHNLALMQIKSEINYFKSKLFAKKNLFEIINICIDSLTEVKQYIIKCIYFHKMTFKNILKNLQYNKKFNKKRNWCISTILKYKKDSLILMESILNQSYNFDIAPIF